MKKKTLLLTKDIMVMVINKWKCATCYNILELCKENINHKTWKPDTFICKNWHLNFYKDSCFLSKQSIIL